eukprot:8813606-Lingulodinium_polyedra.AAC.1
MDYPVIYFDATTAFLHAPELEVIYTEPPEGYEDEDRALVWQLLRKINGRRDGSQEWCEWLAGV